MALKLELRWIPTSGVERTESVFITDPQRHMILDLSTSIDGDQHLSKGSNNLSTKDQYNRLVVHQSVVILHVFPHSEEPISILPTGAAHWIKLTKDFSSGNSLYWVLRDGDRFRTCAGEWSVHISDSTSVDGDAVERGGNHGLTATPLGDRSDALTESGSDIDLQDLMLRFLEPPDDVSPVEVAREGEKPASPCEPSKSLPSATNDPGTSKAPHRHKDLVAARTVRRYGGHARRRLSSKKVPELASSSEKENVPPAEDDLLSNGERPGPNHKRQKLSGPSARTKLSRSSKASMNDDDERVVADGIPDSPTGLTRQRDANHGGLHTIPRTHAGSEAADITPEEPQTSSHNPECSTITLQSDTAHAMEMDPDSAGETRYHRSDPSYRGDYRVRRIFFSTNSSVQSKVHIIKAFTSLGGIVVGSLPEADALIIGKSKSLTKSAKFLMAIASGKDIVFDSWLVEVARKKQMLSIESFVPRNTKEEQLWQCDIRQAVEIGKQGMMRDMLNGFNTLHITSGLRKQLADTYDSYRTLALMLGVQTVKIDLPSARERSSALIIGAVNDSKLLEEVASWNDTKMWSKDLIPYSVLRGSLQVDDSSFLVGFRVKQEEED